MQIHTKISKHTVNLLPSALSGIQIFLHLGHHFHFVAPESVTLCLAEKKPEQTENGLGLEMHTLIFEMVLMVLSLVRKEP